MLARYRRHPSYAMPLQTPRKLTVSAKLATCGASWFWQFADRSGSTVSMAKQGKLGRRGHIRPASR